ncbi:MAG: formylglycine-generating enzyme family protein [bacterium]|nr:formylglycine-generating enzyme family protein [bacterium]
MKKITGKIFTIALLFTMIAFSACSSGFNSNESAPADNEIRMIWQGYLSAAPENPEENWAYYDVIDGKVYHYTNSAWKTLIDAYTPGYTPDTDSGNIEMIRVPATTAPFSMGYEGVSGTPPAIPVHTVASINAFEIGKYEVTRALWDEVKAWAEAQAGSKQYTFGNAGAGADGKHPVNVISWYDAIAWCNALSEKKGLTPCYYYDGSVYRKVAFGDISNDDVDWNANGYRLLTESEWEYAARYLDGTNFTQGNRGSGSTEDINQGKYAWLNGAGSTQWVGTKPPNALGIYDMSGNTFEWVWDWSGNYTGDVAANFRGPDTGTNRILRGGSYVWAEGGAFTSFRHHVSPGTPATDIGFRLAQKI